MFNNFVVLQLYLPRHVSKMHLPLIQLNETFLFKILRPKKSSFVSGNRPGENYFMTHPRAQSNVYRSIYFQLQKNKRTKKKTRIQKKQKKLKKKREHLRKINFKNLQHPEKEFSCHPHFPKQEYFLFCILFYFYWPKYNDVLSLMRFHSHYTEYRNFIRDIFIPFLQLMILVAQKASGLVKS